MKRKFVRIAGWLLCLVTLLSMLTACGAGGGSAGGSGDFKDAINEIGGFAPGPAGSVGVDGNYDSSSSENADAPGAPGSNEMGSEYDAYIASRKIVRTANINCETKTYDSFFAWLDRELGNIHGYIESSSEGQNIRYSDRLAYANYNSYDYSGKNYNSGEYMTRYANITLRVPSEHLDGFLSMLGDQCNVTSRNVSSDDITLQYVDAESYVKALEIERDRLLELLEQADNIDTMLTIESKLTEIKYQMENYQSRLRLMNNQVSFSTVNIYLEEVMDFTEITNIKLGYWSRLSASFGHSFDKLIGFLEQLSLWLADNFAGLAVVAIIVILAVRTSRKRREKNPEKYTVHVGSVKNYSAVDRAIQKHNGGKDSPAGRVTEVKRDGGGESAGMDAVSAAASQDSDEKAGD